MLLPSILRQFQSEIRHHGSFYDGIMLHSNIIGSIYVNHSYIYILGAGTDNKAWIIAIDSDL
jgi:hypothetical protein